MSVAVGPAFALGRAARSWAQALGDGPDGAPAARVHAGATLAGRDPAREFQALANGSADLAVGSSLAWSVQVPPLAAASLPFVAATWAELEGLASRPIAERLAEAVVRRGAVLLAVAPLGHRELIARSGSLRTPADAEGLRVRVGAFPLLADFYLALGSHPASMPLPLARGAFRDGTLDAQEGWPQRFLSANLDALALKHVTVWGAVAELAMFAASREAWERLDSAMQASLRATATTIATGLGMDARREADAALDALWGRGVAVTRLAPATRAMFAGRVASMRERWSGAVGPDLAEAVERASAALR